MIISHELKIIFLKPKKVAGTSMEIALSKFCGEDDIITPITRPDEETRQRLGFRTAQNYVNPKWFHYQNGEKVLAGQTKGKFYNHIPAVAVKLLVPPKVWKDYLIVSMVRSPFDVIISAYFWEGAKVPFENFVENNLHFLTDNYAITHIGKEPVVEFYVRYEHLEPDIKTLEEKIGRTGLWEQFRTINAKGNIRPKRGTSVGEYFSKSPSAARLVKSLCDYEIEKFGYGLQDYVNVQ